MHLYIIRHGQSTNNRLYLETGNDQGRVYDPELSDLGQRQAKCLGEYLFFYSTLPAAPQGQNEKTNITHL